jgi:hypothetical protein
VRFHQVETERLPVTLRTRSVHIPRIASRRGVPTGSNLTEGTTT